jgi:hypothetical protein
MLLWCPVSSFGFRAWRLALSATLSTFPTRCVHLGARGLRFRVWCLGWRVAWRRRCRGVPGCAPHTLLFQRGGKPETRDPTPETRIPKPGTRNPKPGSRNPKPGTRNPKPGTRNPKPETRDPKPGTRNPKPERARSGQRKTPKP